MSNWSEFSSSASDFDKSATTAPPLRARRDRPHGGWPHRRLRARPASAAAAARRDRGHAVRQRADQRRLHRRHVHYPQLPIIGAGGKPLLDWLSGYTFAAGGAIRRRRAARVGCRAYLRENLRNGITTAAVFCTVHAGPSMRCSRKRAAPTCGMIAGKVLMDRNAPAGLLDTATGLRREQGADRPLARATAGSPTRSRRASPPPRRRATRRGRRAEARASRRVRAIARAENVDRVALVGSMFPEASSYLDVYARHHLTGPRTIYGHGVHLDERDFEFLHATDTALAHCPTSNNFLGSGLFRLGAAKRPDRPVRVGLATDRRRHDFSILRTMQAAYEVAQLRARRSRRRAPSTSPRAGPRTRSISTTASAASRRAWKPTSWCWISPPRPSSRCAWRYASDIEEALAIQMALGDDRAVRATYVAGRRAYDRDAREFARGLR